MRRRRPQAADGGAWRERYGPCALVVGASEGIGAAFADALAARGLDLVLVARRPEPLEETAQRLRDERGVQVLTVVGDLRDPALVRERLAVVVAEREVGLVVANAALAPVGPFLAEPDDVLAGAVEVNARGAVLLARTVLPPMVGRGRGGLVLMTSVAGLQGSRGLVAYAATKSFLLVLAEGLWAELRPHDVDVLACAAGAVRTPGYDRVVSRAAPGTLAPDAVVAAALAHLGRGPRVVPGAVNQVAAALLTRLLPRRAAIALISRASPG